MVYPFLMFVTPCTRASEAVCTQIRTTAEPSSRGHVRPPSPTSQGLKLAGNQKVFTASEGWMRDVNVVLSPE